MQSNASVNEEISLSFREEVEGDKDHNENIDTINPNQSHKEKRPFHNLVDVYLPEHINKKNFSSNEDVLKKDISIPMKNTKPQEILSDNTYPTIKIQNKHNKKNIELQEAINNIDCRNQIKIQIRREENGKGLHYDKRKNEKESNSSEILSSLNTEKIEECKLKQEDKRDVKLQEEIKESDILKKNPMTTTIGKDKNETCSKNNKSEIKSKSSSSHLLSYATSLLQESGIFACQEQHKHNITSILGLKSLVKGMIELEEDSKSRLENLVTKYENAILRKEENGEDKMSTYLSKLYHLPSTNLDSKELLKEKSLNQNQSSSRQNIKANDLSLLESRHQGECDVENVQTRKDLLGKFRSDQQESNNKYTAVGNPTVTSAKTNNNNANLELSNNETLRAEAEGGEIPPVKYDECRKGNQVKEKFEEIIKHQQVNDECYSSLFSLSDTTIPKNTMMGALETFVGDILNKAKQHQNLSISLRDEVYLPLSQLGSQLTNHGAILTKRVDKTKTRLCELERKYFEYYSKYEKRIIAVLMALQTISPEALFKSTSKVITSTANFDVDHSNFQKDLRKSKITEIEENQDSAMKKNEQQEACEQSSIPDVESLEEDGQKKDFFFSGEDEGGGNIVNIYGQIVIPESLLTLLDEPVRKSICNHLKKNPMDFSIEAVSPDEEMINALTTLFCNIKSKLVEQGLELFNQKEGIQNWNKGTLANEKKDNISHDRETQLMTGTSDCSIDDSILEGKKNLDHKNANYDKNDNCKDIINNNSKVKGEHEEIDSSSSSCSSSVSSSTIQEKKSSSSDLSSSSIPMPSTIPISPSSYLANWLLPSGSANASKRKGLPKNTTADSMDQPARPATSIQDPKEQKTHVTIDQEQMETKKNSINDYEKNIHDLNHNKQHYSTFSYFSSAYHAYHAAYQASTYQATRDKYLKLVEKAEIARYECVEQYRDYVCNSLVAIQELQFVLTEYQLLEERYNEVIQQLLQKSAVVESSFLANIQYDLQTRFKVLEQIHPESDICSFMQKNVQLMRNFERQRKQQEKHTHGKNKKDSNTFAMKNKTFNVKDTLCNNTLNIFSLLHVPIPFPSLCPLHIGSGISSPSSSKISTEKTHQPPLQHYSLISKKILEQMIDDHLVSPELNSEENETSYYNDEKKNSIMHEGRYYNSDLLPIAGKTELNTPNGGKNKEKQEEDKEDKGTLIPASTLLGLLAARQEKIATLPCQARQLLLK